MEYDLPSIKDICEALKEADPWESKLVSKIKSDIKRHKLLKQDYVCCYCLRDITSEFMMVLDLDHILPQSIYDNCIFDLENLAVSCKRCNMNVKRARTDYIKYDLKENFGLKKYFYFKSEHYLIIHPFCDYFYNHIQIEEKRINSERFRKYWCITEKGKYTYKFFRLKEFEINSISAAQGVGQNLLSDDSKLNLEIKVNELFNEAGISLT